MRLSSLFSALILYSESFSSLGSVRGQIWNFSSASLLWTCSSMGQGLNLEPGAVAGSWGHSTVPAGAASLQWVGREAHLGSVYSVPSLSFSLVLSLSICFQVTMRTASSPHHNLLFPPWYFEFHWTVEICGLSKR